MLFQTNEILLIIYVIEVLRRFMSEWDVESNVKWCAAMAILDNRNLIGNTSFRFHFCGGQNQSFFASFKKCKHEFLIVDATSLFLQVKAIFHKTVQNGFAAGEDIHA